MTDYKTLIVEINNNIAQITYNRPEFANGMSPEMANDLFYAAIECSENSNIRAVILTGTGKMFCAGGDLKAFAAAGDKVPSVVKESAILLHDAISLFSRMDAPLIVAVNGIAAGAGFSTAIIGDYVIASEKAKFTMAYTGVGLSPDGSSTYFLPRLIGLRKSQELILTNRVLSAEEACEWGLINKVVAADSLLDEALTIATVFANGPTQAYGKVKKLLLSSFDNGLETQLELETQCITECARSKDGREGIKAFSAKRKPEFVGE